MHDEYCTPSGWKRVLVLSGIALAGLVAIVGSGGGGVGFIGDPCSGPYAACGPVATALIAPARVTVQVGTMQRFTAQTSGIAAPTYQWQRSSDGGHNFVDIPGATSAVYVLPAANLADDAAMFRVIVQPSGGGAGAYADSRLAVSSAPGVLFQDGDFASAGWQVSEVSVPPNNGAAHTEERVDSGGNSGAFRRMTHAFPANQQSLGVLNLSAAAVYDPAVSGGIHVIDYAEDCTLLSAGNSSFQAWSSLLIEQDGRHYRPKIPLNNYCASASWTPLRDANSLAASDFELLDGTACGAGQACPDFSVSAPPLRFGFVRFAQANTTPTVHGIDNWSVTVWRR